MQNNSSYLFICNRNLTTTLLGLILAMGLICSAEIFALPELNQVVSGDINIPPSASNTLQINQTTDKVILNWNSFNIAAQEGVHFQQPANAICLNRIDAANGMSQIHGSLSSTAKIFLVNQAGILFGEKAQVNVGGIIASAADITNENFLKNKIIFDQVSSLNGAIINRGTLNIADYGLAALLGANVIDEGVIQAKMSSITLATGSKFALDFYGDQVINFEVTAATTAPTVDDKGNVLTDGVRASGQIINDAGNVLITGKAAQGVFDNLINMDGVISAKTVSEHNGAIILLGDEAGIVKVTGQLNVAGNAENTDGGVAMVLGADVVLTEGTNINASGQVGGGSIFLGDWSEGSYSLAPFSKTVTVDQSVNLNADAVKSGDGGEILIWSNTDTKFHGKATARGGAVSGDGGFVEISSKGDWTYDEKTAFVDTSAPNGAAGTLLFDPKFLIVKTSGGSPYFANINNIYANNATGTNTLTPASIVTAAGLNNIRLQANSDVIFSDNLAITSSGKTLTINAGRSVLFNANVSTNNGAIIVTANDTTAQSANRSTTDTGNPAGDTETANGNITMGSGNTLSSGTANLTMTVGTSTSSPYSPGDITVGALTGSTITLTTPNSVFGLSTIAASTNLTIDVGATSSIAGVISGNGSLTKKSAGTLTLNSANTISGATSVQGGILQAGVADILANSSSVTLSNTSGVAFDLNDTNQAIKTLSGGGASGGDITLGSGTLTVTQNSNATYTGIISGAGGLTKEGTSQLTLSGVNTYTGTTTINAGNLRTGVANAISSSSPIVLANTATAALTLNNFNQSVGTLSGGGATGGNISLGSATLTVNQGADNTYAGVISGTGGITKAGSSRLTLSGVNTYTGVTTINAGKLQAGVANAISSSSPVTLANTSGAVFDLNDFNQAIGTLSGGGATGGNITLGSATLTVTQGVVNTYAGVISGTGGITKGGASRLTLSGANTYTGATAVTAGTLQTGAANVIAGPVNLANTSGVVLDLNSFNQSIGNLSGGGATGGNITLGSATLSVNQDSANNYSGIISGTGGLTKDGSATLILNGTNTYTGTTTINSGALQAGAANVISSSSPVTLANTTGAALDLNDFNQAVNTLSGGGTNGGNITLGSATLTVNQSGNSTYAGVISGSGGVTVNGSAILTLSGANTYTGATNISAGTLQAGAANVIASSSAVTLANTSGAALDLNNFNQSINNLSGGGGTGGNITLGSGTLTVNQGSASSYSGVISGTGGFTKAGSATLTLSGANTYTGITTVNAGILQAGAAHAIPSGSALTLANTAGAAFDLNNFDQAIDGLWGGGVTGGNITLGSASLTVSQHSFGTFSGVISGTGDVILANTSTNTLVLAGANTYSGETYVNGGNLKVTADTNIGTAPGSPTANSLNFNGGTLEVGATFTLDANRGINVGASGGTIQVNPTFTLTYDGVIAGSGALTKTGAGILLLNGVNTYSGATNISAGILSTGVANAIANTSALSISNTSGAQFVLNDFNQTVGTLSGGGANGGDIDLGSATLTVNQGTANTYAGVISGTGGLTTDGSARLTLSGANTYTGATTVNSGTLQAGAANVIANTSALELANTTGATFDLNSFNQSVGTLSGGGASGGNITLGSAMLTVTQGSTDNFAGVISGSGGLIKDGSATLTLDGANLYTGVTIINAGKLEAGAANVIASTSAVNLANTAGAEFALNNFNQSIGSLLGGGTTGGNITLGSATLTVTQTYANTYGGVISGTGALNKNGSATLTLAGTNTYTGTTTINAGALRANATDIIAASDAVVLANTAGAMFDLNNFDQTIGTLSGGGSTGGNIALGTATLTINQGATNNYAGVVSGTGGIILDGTNTLNLSGVNTYTGATTINAGTLQAGDANVIANSGSLILADDATAAFDLNDFNQTIGSLSGGGVSGGNIDLGTGILLVNQTTPGTYAGEISGAGNLVLSTGSTDTLILSGINTYTGSTSVRAGKLSISDDANLGTPPGSPTANAVNLNGGTLEIAATIALDANRGISLGASNGTIQVDPTFVLTYDGVIAGTGALTKAGTGSLVLGGVNTYSGATIVDAGTIQTTATDSIANTSALTLANDASAVFDLNDFDQTVGSLSGGGVSGGDILLGAGNLTVVQGNAGVYAGVISGTGGFTKNGNSTLTLSGANTYTGTTAVNAGTLQAGAENIIASTSPLVLADVTGATFDLNNFDQEVGPLSGGGTSGGNIILGSATLTVNQDASDSYSGIISGTGGVTLDGTDTLILNGANTYTGATTINSGVLQAGAENVIANASAIVLADDSSAVFDLNDFNQSVGTLSGGGASGGNIMLGNATLTVNESSDTTYAGEISDFTGGGLTLIGGGVLTLEGASTYSGVTTIDSGTLKAGANNIIANSTGLILANASDAAFDLNDFDQTVGTLSGGGGAGGNITLGNATLDIVQTDDSTYFGIISGSGNVTKSGLYTLNLGGVNAYTGTTTIDVGTLQAGAVDTISTSNPINISAGAVFDLNGYNQNIDVLSGASGGTAVNVILGSAVLNVNQGTDLVIQQ